jgi:tetratricopeptide (TPR) repeat protein
MDINKSIQLAFQHYQTGDLQQAKHICTEILKEQPNNEAMLYLLGVVYAQLEEYDLAVQHLKKSLQCNTYYADAYLALGVIFQKKGLSDEAISYYQKAIEVEPDFAEAYENLGDIFRGKQKLDEAIAYYKRAIQYSPDSAEIYCTLANIFKEKGQHDLAIFYYRKALMYKPDYAEAYNNLGIIFREQIRLDEAKTYFQKALQLNPNYAEALYSLGLIDHQLGYTESATKCIEKAEAIEYSYLKKLKKKKIAFLFLVRNKIINEEIWTAFLKLHKDEFNLYIHSKEEFNGKYFEENVIYAKIPTAWANTVNAQNELLRVAFLDKENFKFIFLSETCLPLLNFNSIFNSLNKDDRSYMSNYPIWFGSSCDRYIKELPTKHLRANPQWLILNRNHSKLFLNEGYIQNICTKYPADQEHYYSTCLSFYNKLPDVHDKPTTFVDWSRSVDGNHPYSFEEFNDYDLNLLKKKREEGILFARKFPNPIVAKKYFNLIVTNEG